MPRSGPVPRSTYRLQLGPAFGFDAVASLAPYLARLGMSHVYLSPCLQAAAGSTHGYDVVDHSKVSEDLGGAGGHRRMCGVLDEAGLGQVLDIVPNHMAVTAGNAWWWDVLENGRSSRYARYFDVDWDPPQAKLRNTVLMPVLGDHYGRVLEAGEIRLAREGSRFSVHYYEHVLPVAPRSLGDLLVAAANACGSTALENLGVAFGRLPLSWATDHESVREQDRDKEALAASLARLLDEDPGVAGAVDAEIDRVNADPDLLDDLLEHQNYRLAYWRTAGRELDYRRFFDIHTLAALRVEDEPVFADTHALVTEWLRDGVIEGLRIDHPDGLRHPEAYLRRLVGLPGSKPWVVVEKILEPGERLPATWPVAGTTGYDFAHRVTGLFVDPGGEEPLTAAYAAFTGDRPAWGDVVRDKKHLVMREVLSAEVNRLTVVAIEVCESHRRYRDYTRHELVESLREIIAAFPVYRTYVVPGTEPSAADTAHVEEAVKAAKAQRPDLDADLLDFLGEIMLSRHPGEAADELVARLQQVTGPVMAKGVEDTAFYSWNLLVCLNEVGSDPSRFGVTVDEFHRANAESHRTWPATMVTTSTHDTKRSEDVRARLALLSEIPDRFAEAVAYWSAHNKRHRSGDLPDRNMEWLLYQTLVGAWPLPAERARPYMEKAAKEAKERTSWVHPDPAYDDALAAFVEGVLADADFVAQLERFVAPLVGPGRVNSLAMTLLKLTSPGIPDIYQGTELWDLSLVDPDNRRPVDWELRARLLEEAETSSPARAWAERVDSGLPKLLLTQRALHLRGRRAQAFRGEYEPLRATGGKNGHVVAYTRGRQVMAVAPRLVLGLDGDWGDTTLELPRGNWVDVLDGERRWTGSLRLSELLHPFPVALLEKR